MARIFKKWRKGLIRLGDYCIAEQELNKRIINKIPQGQFNRIVHEIRDDLKDDGIVIRSKAEYNPDTKQDDGKQAVIEQIIHELSEYDPQELAAVCLHENGIKESDIATSDVCMTPFGHNTRMHLSQIDRGIFNTDKIRLMSMWLKRHHF